MANRKRKKRGNAKRRTISKKENLALSALKHILFFLKDTVVLIAKLIWKILCWLASFTKNTVAPQVEEQVKKSKRPKNLPKISYFTELRDFEGSLDSFEEWLYSSKSTIGIILGARGTGKSALGMRILENWAGRGAKVCAMGFNEETIPSWIKVIENMERAPNSSVVLVDESGISFSSRETMSDANKLLSELLLVARHKDISIIFIAQNSANIEINSIRQADYLLLKRPSLLQKDFERGKIKNIYSEVEKDFKELRVDKGLVYIYSDRFRGFASNNLPTFWSQKASKAFEKK
jgi:hypothetical protein